MGRRHGLGEKGLSVSGFSAKGGLVVFEELAPRDRQDGEACWLFVIHALVLSLDETHSAIRLCTSWGTKPEYVDEFCRDLRALVQR